MEPDSPTPLSARNPWKSRRIWEQRWLAQLLGRSRSGRDLPERRLREEGRGFRGSASWRTADHPPKKTEERWILWSCWRFWHRSLRERRPGWNLWCTVSRRWFSVLSLGVWGCRGVDSWLDWASWGWCAPLCLTCSFGWSGFFYKSAHQASIREMLWINLLNRPSLLHPSCKYALQHPGLQTCSEDVGKTKLENLFGMLFGSNLVLFWPMQLSLFLWFPSMTQVHIFASAAQRGNRTSDAQRRPLLLWESRLRDHGAFFLSCKDCACRYSEIWLCRGWYSHCGSASLRSCNAGQGSCFPLQHRSRGRSASEQRGKARTAGRIKADSKGDRSVEWKIPCRDPVIYSTHEFFPSFFTPHTDL